jgi:hypothetical protein
MVLPLFSARAALVRLLGSVHRVAKRIPPASPALPDPPHRWLVRRAAAP